MAYTISNSNSEIHFTETGVMNNKFIADFLKHFFPGDPIFQDVPDHTKNRKHVHVPTKENFDKVLSVVKDQDYVMLKFFELTGARAKEVFMQKWSDIHFDQNCIYFWTMMGNHEDKELNSIPMPPELKELLLDWKEKQPIQTEYVFVNNVSHSKGYGKPYKNRGRFMHHVCEEAGVPYFGFHGIRRFTAMQLSDAGHPTSHIQRILRHKHESSTSQYMFELHIRHFKEIEETY
ncbi:MAG: tyrosine-type recombinase/integrase [Desulfovibrio sp.]